MHIVVQSCHFHVIHVTLSSTLGACAFVNEMWQGLSQSGFKRCTTSKKFPLQRNFHFKEMHCFKEISTSKKCTASNIAQSGIQNYSVELLWLSWPRDQQSCARLAFINNSVLWYICIYIELISWVVDLVGVDLKEVDLVGVGIMGVDLVGVDLVGVELIRGQQILDDTSHKLFRPL